MVAGTGNSGSTPSELSGPTNLFVDDDRTIYIVDLYNYRIQKWTYGASSGVTVAGFGSLGSAANQLDNPMAVIVDSNQYMYISDQLNNRIQRWALGACAGECLVGCSGVSGNGSSHLSSPQSVAFDNHGALYVSDGGNHRVQKFLLISAVSKSSLSDPLELHVRYPYDSATSNFPPSDVLLASQVDRLFETVSRKWLMF